MKSAELKRDTVLWQYLETVFWIIDRTDLTETNKRKTKKKKKKKKNYRRILGTLTNQLSRLNQQIVRNTQIT